MVADRQARFLKIGVEKIAIRLGKSSVGSRILPTYCPSIVMVSAKYLQSINSSVIYLFFQFSQIFQDIVVVLGVTMMIPR